MDEHYKNFLISARALRLPKNKKGWRSLGVITDPYTHPMMELKRIETKDVIFEKQEEAEACAVQLCRDWINERFGYKVK